MFLCANKKQKTPVCHCFVGSGLDRSGGHPGKLRFREAARWGQDPTLRCKGQTGVFYSSSAVGAGHARPGCVRQTGACGKAAGRTCPAPTVRSCFYVEITVSSPGGMNPSPTMQRANRRFYCSSAVGAGHARPGGVPADGRLREGRGPDMSGPYRRITGASQGRGYQLRFQ